MQNSRKRLTIIGAGSSYTPELIHGLAESIAAHRLDLTEICCMDEDRERMSLCAEFAVRILRKHHVHTPIYLTTDLSEAIKGARFVINQIRVGGMEARIHDERIPLEFGLLGQETTGAGGCMNALRTIPVVLRICELMTELAPDAWLLNFTNPSGLLTQAMKDHYPDLRIVGLCNGPINMQYDVARLLGRDDFTYDFMGLNHLCWITSVRAPDGAEHIGELHGSGWGEISSLKNIPDRGYAQRLLQITGGLPIGYLKYYFFRDEQIRICQEQAERGQTRGEVCRELEGQLFQLYADPDLVEKPDLLLQRGGARYSQAAVTLMESLDIPGGEALHVVNVLNQGAYDAMEDDDVVEVLCRVSLDSIIPVPQGQTASRYITGLMQSVKAYERLTMQAAVSGDDEEAVVALMAHPLVGDVERAEGVIKKFRTRYPATTPC